MAPGDGGEESPRGDRGVEGGGEEGGGGDGEVEKGGEGGGPAFICHLLGVHGDYASYFHASSPRFFFARCGSKQDHIERGMLCSVRQDNKRRDTVHITALPEQVKSRYTSRQLHCLNGDLYEHTVLRSLLLECRLRDYEQSCAHVIQLNPLVISIRAANYAPTTALFRADSGLFIGATVTRCARYDRYSYDEGCELHCTPLSPLPGGVVEGSRLEHCSHDYCPANTTTALERRAYDPILNRSQIIERIYGEYASIVDPGLPTKSLAMISAYYGNSSVATVVGRYQSGCCACAVETDEACDAATVADLITSVAGSQGGEGAELFLAPNNEAVVSMAQALAENTFGRHRNVVHLLSMEDELDMTEEELSPYSIFSQLMHQGRINLGAADFNRLKEEWLDADEDSSDALRDAYARALEEHSAPDDYGVIFATVETALGQALRVGSIPKPPPLP